MASFPEIRWYKCTADMPKIIILQRKTKDQKERGGMMEKIE